MSFPFEALSLSQRELGLIVGVVLGFVFGFVLERAGFGRATKLAAQFYLTDMTVLKVMFSAIVTAMGGLLVVAGLGLTDLPAISQSIASWTWIWPMLIGGFVLGAGFIVSGYCPGTAIVSAGSGNVDGMVAFAGVVSGSFVYNLLLEIPAVAKFHTSGELGPAFIHELIGVPAPVVGVAVVLMAIGAFIGSEKVEAIVRRRRAGEEPPRTAYESRPRRFAFATFLTLAALGVVLLALPQRSDARDARPMTSIPSEELAKLLIDEPWSLRVIDFRPATDFAAARIPTSENVSAEKLRELGLEYADPSRPIVIVTAGPASRMPAGLATFRGEVLALDGGWAAWKSFALDPAPTPEPDASASERDLYAFRSALSASLAGRTLEAVPAAPARSYAPKPRTTGGGCNG
ncbi:MAG: YeeE/YedE family protein [Thermoanaerobaculia bacterium]|nr:YeeE/YedE family protein [Thermoanaerobaculia bacterium]